ncbi:MAG: glycosyl transferase family 1 [Hyphomicrobiales bacterium]|nr:MAG: glycosyl transferase family 1 [Hyphomicrobiales bacterium]
MKILFIHLTGAFGGSSRSLIEAVGAFPDKVDAYFLTPRGTVETFFSKLGKVLAVRGLSQFDNTQYSYYRGFRWLVALREIAYLPATFAAIRQARRQWPDIDLIHVNEFTGLLPMWLAKRQFGVPVVVHVRSVARLDSQAWRTRFVNKVMRDNADVIVAIDETVRQSLPSDLPIEVIHNAFTPQPVGQLDKNVLRAIEKLRPGALRVGFVGNLLKVKGIQDLVEAARIVKQCGGDVEYVIVGDDARSSTSLKARLLHAFGLNQNIKALVEKKIILHGLSDNFHMLGFMRDIALAYRYFDVLCFPSHFNAPGRPVFEAAFSSVPSIVAVTNPTNDTLIDSVTGLAVPPHAPQKLAQAILDCEADREKTKSMGIEAHKLAEQNFSVGRNAAKLFSVFETCLRV